MSAAVKKAVSTETVKAGKSFAASKGGRRPKATGNSHLAREEAQRRKWGVETGAVRSVHARKF
jgi:hypothetical protein